MTQKSKANILMLLSFALILFLSTLACANTDELAPTQLPDSSPAVAPPSTPTQDPSIYPDAGIEPPPEPAVSEYGPWIFYQVDPHFRGGNFAYQLANGSEPKLLDDPAYMGDFEIFLNGEFTRLILPSPSGDKVSFYVVKENKAQVWVLDLVENAIDAKIELFLTETNEDPNNILSRYLWRHKMMQWSPDGNFLAVVANIQGSEHNLLLHDFPAEETRTLAEHVQHIGLVDWSPDSHSILYVTLPKLGPTVPYASIWTANIDGEPLLLTEMSPAYMSYSMGWLDKETAVIYDRQWEMPASNILEVNVRTGEFKSIIDEFLLDVFLLPGKQLVFSNIYGTSIYYPEPPTEMEQGIYLYDFELDEFDLLLPSKSAYLANWFPEIENFHVFEGQTAYFYNVTGEIVWETEPTRHVFPSPDGKYILIAKDSQIRLYEPSGNLIWSTLANTGGRVIWLPNSSGFYSFNESDLGKFISLYTESIGWEAEILDNVIWTEYEYQTFIVE